MKKEDVGMAKRFSKKYGNKGWRLTTCNPMSRCLSAPDATSLHHCLKTAKTIMVLEVRIQVFSIMYSWEVCA